MDLKVWPEFYEKLLSVEKTFEIRRDDRGYRCGDWLRLREWMPKAKEYTGRVMHREVTYLMAGGAFGLDEGYVAMALAPLPEAVPPEVVIAPASSVPAATPAPSAMRKLLSLLAEDFDPENDFMPPTHEYREAYFAALTEIDLAESRAAFGRSGPCAPAIEVSAETFDKLASLATAPAPRTYGDGFADAREMAARLAETWGSAPPNPQSRRAALAAAIRALAEGAPSPQQHEGKDGEK